MMPEEYHQYKVFNELKFLNFRFMYALLNDVFNPQMSQRRADLEI